MLATMGVRVSNIRRRMRRGWSMNMMLATTWVRRWVGRGEGEGAASNLHSNCMDLCSMWDCYWWCMAHFPAQKKKEFVSFSDKYFPRFFFRVFFSEDFFSEGFFSYKKKSNHTWTTRTPCKPHNKGRGLRVVSCPGNEVRGVEAGGGGGAGGGEGETKIKGAACGFCFLAQSTKRREWEGEGAG